MTHDARTAGLRDKLDVVRHRTQPKGGVNPLPTATEVVGVGLARRVKNAVGAGGDRGRCLRFCDIEDVEEDLDHTGIWGGPPLWGGGAGVSLSARLRRAPRRGEEAGFGRVALSGSA